MAERGVQGVKYEKVGDEYFAQRKLRRYAGVFSLWALGVGAVISGQFSGWNYGLEVGWGSLFAATVIITIMYVGLTYSIAEMSPALPHTGGAYSFARSAMGPWGGFVTGVAENIEYVLTPAVVVYFIGAYVSGILQLAGVMEDATALQPLFWLLGYLIFVGFNLFGVELSFRVTVVVTLLALACLAFFYIAALPLVDFNRWAMNVGVENGETIELANGAGVWFPRGIDGVLAALPFAVWLYLAIEQLPLAAEESADPRRDMPKGILLGMLTLAVSAFAVLFINSSISPGAFGLRASGEPLLEGFRTLFGKDLVFLAILFSLIAITGLVASFHAIIFAYGRQIYSLSRAGYFPRVLSVTHGSHRTPQIALVLGAVVGLAVMALIWFSNDQATRNAIIGTSLLNMAVFGAMISYVLQAASFIVLRLRMPHIERPYRSPFGIAGAGVTLVIAVVTMFFQVYREDFRGPVLWVAGYYALMIVYFALVGRTKLV
ncbi:MAG: amino acid permease, partial [Candidatus Binataceae bacterium]